MKPGLQTRVVVPVVALLAVVHGHAAEPAQKLLAEKEIVTILAQSDKLLSGAERAQQRRELAEFEKLVGDYTQSANRLSQALEEDRFAAEKPEQLLWRVDKSALKQRTALEKLLRQSPKQVQVAVEGALAAARRASRAALDAIARLREKEFRLGPGHSGGFHQERKEEVYVPGTPSPRPRPQPKPEPPPER